MSALNHLTKIRHHRVHTASRSQTAGYQPDVVATTLTAYLAVHRWQVAEIEEGLRQAEVGEFASDAEVEVAYAAFQ